jgi:hypothetical protein
MSFFGLTDPWIWGSYVACFATVALCAVYYYIHRNDKEGENND